RGAGAGRGCVGARLLFEVPKPAQELPRRLVERRQLGRSRRAVCEGEIGAESPHLNPLPHTTGERKPDPIPSPVSFTGEGQGEGSAAFSQAYLPLMCWRKNFPGEGVRASSAH